MELCPATMAWCTAASTPPCEGSFYAISNYILLATVCTCIVCLLHKCCCCQQDGRVQVSSPTRWDCLDNCSIRQLGWVLAISHPLAYSCTPDCEIATESDS